MERNLRKEIVGIVVSDKMDKTVVVAVSEKRPHPSTRRPSPIPAALRRTTKPTSAASAIRCVSSRRASSAKTRTGASLRSSKGRSNAGGERI